MNFCLVSSGGHEKSEDRSQKSEVEGDLLNKFGEEYEQYRRQVSMIISLPRKK